MSREAYLLRIMFKKFENGVWNFHLRIFFKKCVEILKYGERKKLILKRRG
jgi:hypothetical protein